MINFTKIGTYYFARDVLWCSNDCY